MSTLQVGTISEKVTDAGVAVDGVTLKDGGAVFTSAVTATDNTVDLGASGTRFKDIYLSGGAFLGGTGSANKISDYEEGTFEVTFTPSVSGTVTAPSGSNLLKYVKIGTAVFISGGVNNIAISSPNGELNMNTLPFANGTGTDNSGRTAGVISFGGTDTTSSGSSGGKFMAWGFIGESSTTVAIQVDSTQFNNNATDMYFNFFYRTDS